MSDANTPTPATLRHVLLSAGIGSALEWYDFYIFSLASALVFGPLFFPGGDPFLSTLASFGTFAVGFFARPLGGIVFGHWGDRIGRKKALIIGITYRGTANQLNGCKNDAAHMKYLLTSK